MIISQNLAGMGLSIEVLAGPAPRVSGDWHAIGYTLAVKKDAKTAFETPYSLGTGHVNLTSVPLAYLRFSSDECMMLESWIKKPSANFKDKAMQLNVACKLAKIQKLKPSIEDVFYSLSSDAGALDYPTYGAWAGDFGYGEDSRRGEAVYRQCLGISLKLRAIVGESGLEKLRVMYRDY